MQRDGLFSSACFLLQANYLLKNVCDAINLRNFGLDVLIMLSENLASMNSDNELFLWDEIKAGNERAFRLLYVRYYRRLVGYADRFVQSREEAEDLVQDAFVKFWERRQLLEGVSVSSLLFTMVRNGCINYLKRQALVDIRGVDWLENLDGEERLYHLDFCPGVEMDFLYKELEAQIPIVLGSLPERSREVFLLSRREGLKNREIAERLAISTTAVEKHIKRALEAFEVHFRKRYPLGVYWLALVMLFFTDWFYN